MEIDTAQSESATPKEAALAAWMAARARVAIGFSGGVDSTYLAVAARLALGPDRVLAIIGRSPSYPAVQWSTAWIHSRRFSVEA